MKSCISFLELRSLDAQDDHFDEVGLLILHLWSRKSFESILRSFLLWYVPKKRFELWYQNLNRFIYTIFPYSSGLWQKVEFKGKIKRLSLPGINPLVSWLFKSCSSAPTSTLVMTNGCENVPVEEARRAPSFGARFGAGALMRNTSELVVEIWEGIFKSFFLKGDCGDAFSDKFQSFQIEKQNEKNLF
jgi:hypothetical protein